MKITNLGNLHVIDQGGLINCALKTIDGYILFDSGLDESNCRKFIRELDDKIIAIFHTHSHADHIGGDYFLIKKFEPLIYIDKREISFAFYPFLEPTLLYGGAAFGDITGKFLMSKPVTNIESFERATSLFEKYNIEPVNLFGHSPGHTGFMIEDILFAGDSIFDEAVIEKYKVLYLFNPEEHLKTLNKIKELDFSKIVYCHKGVLEREDALSFVEKNIQHVESMRRIIFDIANNLTAEEITDILIDKLEIMKSMDIINLVNSTVKGYLRWLNEEGELKVFYDKGVRWSR